MSATSFHKGAGGCEEPRWILVQRREQGREDRGRGQCEDQEDRRREREYFHCTNPVSASIDLSIMIGRVDDFNRDISGIDFHVTIQHDVLIMIINLHISCYK